MSLFAAAALIVAVVAYGAVLRRHTAAVAGGSDSSGYLNATSLLLEGRVEKDLRGLAVANFTGDWARVFMPLGFVPGRSPGKMASSYPPGLPLEMAFAEAVTGRPAARFAIVPISAAALVVLVFLLAAELGLPRWYAILAALLCAFFPTTVFMAVQPMSDVPAAMWATLAVWLALRGRRASGVVGQLLALGAGAAFGLGVLVRPTNALVILPLALSLPPRFTRWLSFAAGGLPAALAFVFINARAYGTPFTTGYGSMAGALVLSNFPVRIEHYGYWMGRLLGVWAPLAWVGSFFDSKITLRTRAILAVWPCSFILFYCFYGPYETWWYTRFLLPALPAIVIAAIAAFRDLVSALSGRKPAWASVLAVTIAAALTVVSQVRFTRAEGVMRLYRSEQSYARACEFVVAHTEPRSVVVAMQMSGAMEYYTNRIYAMWNWMDRDQWAAVRGLAERRGYQWYALLAPFEMEEAMARVPGDWRVEAMEGDIRLLKLSELPFVSGDRGPVSRSDRSAR